MKPRKNVPEQSEFFISTQHESTKERLAVEPLHDPLKYGYRYRFKIRAWSAAGRIVGKGVAPEFRRPTDPPLARIWASEIGNPRTTPLS